ncbi:MAG TPA: TIGR03435 family protein, partial [Dongiaceae bacterium]|nr:TIGR03435 family protein [Dongiaceae bacterium]
GKFETRTVEAFALKESTNQSGLKNGTILNRVVNVGEGESGLLHITSMSELAKRLDGWVKLPVVDQTGLNNHFDLTLRWTTASGSSGDALKKILLDQLGLKLVPTNMPIEMLVVEKVQ